MPQLDSNSFFYQYFGIILLILVIYSILSYIILPNILRITVIKNYFIKITNLNLNILSFINKKFHNFLFIKLSTTTILFINFSNFINFIFNTFSLLIHTQLNILTKIKKIDNLFINSINEFINYFQYLNFLLILENNNE